MFERISDEDQRGQVGIGTLIVFIAMVLVAAIAAGVLINTAGTLQTQASDTGSETQEAVANQIEVVHAVGNVSDDGSQIEYVNLTLMKSAGSDAIDLSSMTVHYTSDRTSETLTHSEAASGEETNNEEINWSLATDASSEFATANITGDGDHSELINVDDRVMMSLDVVAIEDNGGLEGGDSVTLTLVDQSGAQFTYGVSVPSTFGDKQVVEV